MTNKIKSFSKQWLNLVLVFAMIFGSTFPSLAISNEAETVEGNEVSITLDLSGGVLAFDEEDLEHLAGKGVNIIEDEERLEDIITLTVVEGLTFEDLALPEVKRDGFIFEAWNTETDGSGDVIEEEAELTEGLSLFAQWEEEADDSYIVDDEPPMIEPESEIPGDEIELGADEADLEEEAEISPLNEVNVTTFEQLRTAVNNAGSTPTTIHLMAAQILTGAGVAGQNHGGGANPILIGPNQDITLLNGQPGATSRASIVRSVSNAASPNIGPDGSTAWNDINNRRSHELFAIEGILRLGTANPSTPQANNITLDNWQRWVNGSNHIGHPDAGVGNSITGGQMRGGVRVRGNNANLHMHDGAIIQYGRHEDEGGNMRITHGGTFHMHGGIIREGAGDASGGAGAAGGVFLAGTNSRMYMHGGYIENNHLSQNVTGGGVAVVGTAVFTMNGGTIRNNRLSGSSVGGGVGLGQQSGTTVNAGWGGGVANSGTFIMNGGVIEGNTATVNGAGVWVNSGATFNMRGGTIRNNSLAAGNSNGGGVFTANANFSNINIGNVGGIDTSSDIHFYGNHSGAYNGSPLMIRMGVDGGRTTFPNLRWNNWLNAHNNITTSLPAHSHLINNWDVNTTSATPYDVVTVTFLQNSGTVGRTMTSSNPAFTGDVESVIANSGATVSGNVGARPDFYFVNLTTQPVVGGVHNSTSPAFSFTMGTQNVFITAHWNRRVSFDLAGGSGQTPTDRVIGEFSAVGALPATPSHPNGYAFAGWRLADGTAVTAQTTNPNVGHFTIYASWYQSPSWAAPTPDAGSLGIFQLGYQNINFATLFATGFGAQPMTYSLQGNPSWIEVNPTTGVLSILSIPATALGTHTFTAVAANGTAPNAVREFSIEVEPIRVTGVVINEGPNLTLQHHDEAQLTATVFPDNATNPNVTWTSSDPSVITVDPDTGEIVARGPGTAIVTVTTVDGDYTDRITILVPRRVTGVQIDQDDLELTDGDEYQLTATVLPGDATNQTVTWESSNSDIVIIDPDTGHLEAVGEGTVVITVTTEDGNYTDQITIIVHPIVATSLTVTPSLSMLQRGDTLALTATVLPSNVTNPTVMWESLNKAVATVDVYGVVTAVAPGVPVMIIGTTVNGLTATAIVVVTEAPPVIVPTVILTPATVTVDDNNLTVVSTVGGTATGTITLDAGTPSLPAGVVATVDQVTGEITVAGVRPTANEPAITGTFTIAVEREGVTENLTVHVNLTPAVIPVEGVRVTPLMLQLDIGATAPLSATVLPLNATNQEVIWHSLNPAMATVDPITGVVTGHLRGMATITVTTVEGGFTATSLIVVNP